MKDRMLSDNPEGADRFNNAHWRNRVVIFIVILLILLAALIIVLSRVKSRKRNYTSSLPVAFGMDKGNAALIAGYDDKIITKWNVGSATNQNYPGHTRAVNSLVVAPVISRLISASDNEVIIWRFPSMEIVSMLHPTRDAVRSIAIAPGADFFAFGCRNGIVEVTDANFNHLVTLQYSPYPVTVTVIFSPQHRKLAAIGGSNITVWEVGTWKSQTLDWKESRSRPLSIAFSSDGTLLAIGGWKQMLIWDCVKWKPYQTITKFSMPVSALAFSPDGKTLATAEENLDGPSPIKLWSTNGFDDPRTLGELKNPGLSIMFSPDSKLLAVGATDSGIYLWEVERRLLLSCLK